MAAGQGQQLLRVQRGIERGGDGRPTGRLFRLDTWLGERVRGSERPSLAAVGRELAACGVTGVTDATYTNDDEALIAFAEAVERATRALRMLDPAELRELIASGQGQEVECQFCGVAYQLDADELLTRQEVNRLLDHLRERAGKLVEEVVPEVLKPGDVQRVLQALLRERVPIRDLESILEAIADIAHLAEAEGLDAHAHSVRVRGE